MAVPSEPRILLQGAILLIHDESDHVVPTAADLLVEGSVISRIEKTIEARSGDRVIDTRGKIISPGFIDTHRHLYQTQYKGQHANHSLVEYLPTGNFVAGLWTPEDLFWGQLAGALESINAGTTTVVYHSSCNASPDHPQAALQALLSSGIRAVYCFTPQRTVTTNPWKVEDDYLSEPSLSTYRALAKAAPFGNGRVHMGYAVDNLYFPPEVIKTFYADLRDPSKGRAKVITSHAAGGPMRGSAPTPVQILHGHGLLGPDVLISHATFPHDGDAELYRKSGAYVSSTPTTELQMGTAPVALNDDHYHNASLGVDCHSWTSASIPEQMKQLLGFARYERGRVLAERGKWSRHTGFTAEQAFNLGTLGGAKAAGLEKEVGRLKVGMKADLVVFDTTSPAMLAAADQDPVVAVVMHGSPADIDLVLVDGMVRKEGGKLVEFPATAAPSPDNGVLPPGTAINWENVVTNVKKSRLALKERVANASMKDGEEWALQSFQMNMADMIESQS